MNKAKAQQPDDLGALKWLLLVGVFLYAIASLLAWPFRWALDHWPGRRENLLPLVAGRLLSTGHILAQIDEGSDSYSFALCTPEEFSQIESLSDGAYLVRKFENNSQHG